MSTHPLQSWLKRSNAEVMYHLERQGRTGLGLVPFLGAGISIPFGFKNWRDLLLHAAPPQLEDVIHQRLTEGDYEDAAEQLLQELGPDGFQNMVAASAGDSKLKSLNFHVGTVSLLPLLARGPVVTTNFDRVLEHAFAANAIPFDSVISGPRPDLIVDALHGNRRVLIKLHGDWQDRVGRTFARSDYEANYGEAQPERKRELLTAAERLLFSSRSLLFIGASLDLDRTVTLLQDVHQQYAGIRHFAIMKAPMETKEFQEQERHLRQCGILPLWYTADSPEEHRFEVEHLLEEIIDRISVQTIQEPAGERPTPVIKPQTRESSPPIKTLDAHFDRVVRLIGHGRVTFFLGSAIHAPTKLMATEFYEELARIFECEALAEERFAVAQYIADRHGREELYSEIRKLFTVNRLVPREVHELFLAWGHFKNHMKEPVPYPTIITTNYDDVLERCFDEAGLPYHLLSYQAWGEHRGLFYHRCDRGGLRIIERPQNIRRFSDAFILVKLNGGYDRRGQIPESYVTTQLDYWDLATRIPEVLPVAVQESLLANPLLFLGHGMEAPDVESLVRFAHRDHAGPRSWSIVLKETGIEYWRQCGVEILYHRVGDYLNALHDRLLH